MADNFAIHTSNRLELLLDALAERIAAAPLAPLATETIVVPGQGLARWVTLELARRPGVAASLHLPFPGTFLRSLLEQLATDSSARSSEALAEFDRPTLQFRLFRLLGEEKLRRDLGPAASYCDDDPVQHKRAQLAERLARCFDDYQLYRADKLQAFAKHSDRYRLL